jgi:hypothetical protein
MNLIDLSSTYMGETGNPVGFVVKSLSHPDRRYKVEFFLADSGKFAITRLGTGEGYLVKGSEDRYEFAVSMARIREIKAEIGELTEQTAVINDRLSFLKTELVAVS